MKQTPGRIYLADQHGTVTTPQSSRSSVLSFAEYTTTQRPAVGRLLAFNEETLLPGQAVTLLVPRATHLVLLPLTGEVAYQDSRGHTALVQVEDVHVSTLPPGATLELRNPYATEAVSFLHLWLAAELPISAGPTVFQYAFEELENALASIVSGSSPETSQLPFALSLGRFAGRHEAVYRAASPSSLLFTYVLAGAFEAEGRLLHAKDGLALWDAEQFELEALSNNALVVVLEVRA
ncbi:hypothetical protein K3G63_10390 [Hymenobacter sp. HSC-4F20]|uniref:pirin family protein n=1 Tax=Hymenobacter sp. HSC-4F20 TaxID=2864135 RepID=UPI001C7335F3|nr:hypothetical protein [Hymenobacter sp. HSC-4F20]MBX0290849.1 hypothetical protein [Hymenobacter sp. HSC-4F20]